LNKKDELCKTHGITIKKSKKITLFARVQFLKFKRQNPLQKKLFGMLHIYFIEHVNFIQIIGAQFMIIILGLEIMH